MTDAIHRVDVAFTDGTRTFFVSRDGELYYEQTFPDGENQRFSPMKYTRLWLKDLERWDKVKAIEFTP